MNKKVSRSLSLLLILALVLTNLLGFGNVNTVEAESGVITVAEAIANNSGTATVEGYIIGIANSGPSYQTEGPFSVRTNIAMADSASETDVSRILPVQLPIGDIRTALNLVDNPDNLGKKVRITGTLMAYFSVPGLKSPTKFEFVTDDENPTNRVANVTASPVPGAVAADTLVTLSTSTAGATISYAVYKADEAVESGNYNTPIKIDEALTIKAYATKEGLENSDVAEFQYTIKPPVELEDIATAKAKAVGTEVRVKGIGTYSTQSRTLFMQDDSGGVCIDLYGSDISGFVGKEVDITGKISVYGGMVQIAPTSISDIKITNEAPTIPEPLLVTIFDLVDTRVHEGKLIKVENAKVTKIGGTDTSTYNHIIAQGEMEITLRSGALTGKNAGDYITVTGVAGYYNSPQIQANVSDVSDGEPPEVENVTASPASGGTLPIGGTVTLSTTTEGATITYTINDSEEKTIDSNSGIVTINEFREDDGKAVIKAKASKGSYTTPESNFFYTQAKTQMVTATPVGAVDGQSQITLTAADNATIKYIVKIKAGTAEESDSAELTYSEPIAIVEENLPLRITAHATEGGYLNSDSVSFDYYLKSNEPYRNYFGQLHSHTAENSDGSGTLVEAYTYAKAVEGLDFFAVTDHSNAFDAANTDDKAGTYNLGDYNKDNEKWQNGINAAAAALTEDFVSVYGYEMTWSGGPGHMNTFATEGFVSRNNKELNNKSNDAGLKAYYQLIKDTPNSISQFNHPGKTFGTFSDYAYLDPIIDARISLIEVGNGEGAVGSGGYFTSYEEYTKALDRGWHLAPTNNQDNHKGKWGDSNTARTVIYTNDLSVEGLYDALRNMRVYATEDDNLDIVYTLNDEMLGSIMDVVPDKAEFSVTITDPDTDDKIHSVSIISNGGKVVLTETFGTQSAIFEETIDNPAPGYYYVKTVQADGDIAVTAPIWLGSAPKLGISDLEHNKMMPVTNESLEITTSLFNNEETAAIIKSVKYEIKDGSTIEEIVVNESIAGEGGMYSHKLEHTFSDPGIFTVTVTVVISQGGNDVTYSKELEVNVRDSEKLIYIGIDASHNNEYVSGNYKDSMGNFGQLAANYDVRTVELNTSEELLEALENPKYQMMIFTVPSRRDGSTGKIPFKSYSQDEIDAVANFAQSGKTVILTGWGDFYESYSNLKEDPNFTADQHMAAQQNKLLSAIGAKLRLADDEAKDDVLNGGQPQRLYLTDYNNYVDPFTEGVVEEQIFSQYGGSTVFAVDSNGNPVDVLPSNISPIISGHGTTYSTDDDKDGNAIPPKYNDRVLLMANETVSHEDGTKSTIIVAGGAFMSNFEIQVQLENAGTLPYSNYNILENIIMTLKDVAPIADVHSMNIGSQVIIEGVATTGVYNGSDSNKGFFDCIYVQDATAGINLFPVASGVQAGQLIRVLGTVGQYQGEKQIQVESITVLNSEINPVTPIEVTPLESMSPENTGSLVTFTGTVTEIIKDEAGVVGQLMVSGSRVYINGYITKDVSLANIKVGDQVEVIGLASIGENMSSDTDFLPRIRIRDRAEIVKISSPGEEIPRPSTPKEKIKEKTPIELGLIVVEEDIKGSLISRILDEDESNETFSHLTSIEFNPVSEIFDITSSTKLDKPIKLIVKYDTTKVKDPLKLGIYYFNETTKVWEYIGGKVIRDGEIEVTLDHLSKYTVIEYRKTFNDISDIAWAQNEIEVLAARHVINGINDINYAPNKNIQRAEFAKLLVEGLNLKLGSQEISFSDVQAGAWYKEVVDIAASLGIVTGYDGRFDPNGLITREQMATMIVRALKYVEPNASYTSEMSDFIDQDQISAWAKEAVQISASKELVKGLGNGLFSPQQEATRAQSAVIIYRMLDLLDRL
ncbi:MAG: DUF6359 domain-containing protein [Tissierellales bacterium]